MPLHDHFHAPWAEANPWEGFHSAWVNTMVRHLNGTLLPPEFRAIPNVHLGPTIEADASTWERSAEAAPSAAPSVTGAIPWAPPAVQTLELGSEQEEICEVRVVDDRFNVRLTSVVELVTPANKDRPEARQAFVAKCASLLRQRIHLVIVDVVTHRRANLHRELLQALGVAGSSGNDGELYAVSYRSVRDASGWRLGLWPFALTVGEPLPTLPLWLTPDLAVRLDLEASYDETWRVLRIR
jgi:hypothetical protein